MKIEIEISEAEIQEVLRAHLSDLIQAAIRGRSQRWGGNAEVVAAVNKMWAEAVEHHVREAMTDVPALKEKINDALYRKLTAHLTKVLKEQDK
jgi:hypothetical protein